MAMNTKSVEPIARDRKSKRCTMQLTSSSMSTSQAKSLPEEHFSRRTEGNWSLSPSTSTGETIPRGISGLRDPGYERYLGVPPSGRARGESATEVMARDRHVLCKSRLNAKDASLHRDC